MKVNRTWLGLGLLMLPTFLVAVLSVVAAFAASPLMLIVVRALLGVAGATLAPSTLALITNMFLAGLLLQFLPAAQGAGLLQDAREAFTASLHVTGGVAVVIFAGLAVLIVAVRPADPPAPAPLPEAAGYAPSRS